MISYVFVIRTVPINKSHILNCCGVRRFLSIVNPQCEPRATSYKCDDEPAGGWLNQIRGLSLELRGPYATCLAQLASHQPVSQSAR